MSGTLPIEKFATACIEGSLRNSATARCSVRANSGWNPSFSQETPPMAGRREPREIPSPAGFPTTCWTWLLKKLIESLLMNSARAAGKRDGCEHNCSRYCSLARGHASWIWNGCELDHSSGVARVVSLNLGRTSSAGPRTLTKTSSHPTSVRSKWSTAILK